MIKIVHPIDTVMTGQAIHTKLSLVLLHKSSIFLGMAIYTEIHFKSHFESIRGIVAFHTTHGRTRIIGEMPIQAEEGLREVIEQDAIHPHQGRPIERCMAGSTILGEQTSMDLRIGMTISACDWGT